MSCTELGLFDEWLRVSKSADGEYVGTAPSSIDLSTYSAEFVVRATEGAASALLTVNETQTANGSVIVLSGSLITLRLKALDLQTLPDNATDADTPYEAVCELVIVSSGGLRTRIWLLPIIVEKGVAR